MIKKISKIKNIAVFDDFLWDKSVVDENGNSINLEKINIIYGRNYSGKTTLSKIFRAFETGISLDNIKYENPSFSLQTDDDKTMTQDDISNLQLQIIRVFNSDFIRDNLTFLINPDESIKPIAILGEDNKNIEKEIHDLESELGTNEEGKETGLYLKLKNMNYKFNEKNNDFLKKDKKIKDKKQKYALDPTNGIKYKVDLYGEHNYTVNKLENEIENVLLPSYKPLNEKEIESLKITLFETQKKIINPLYKPIFNCTDLCFSTEKLVTKKIGETGKIQELIRETVLNEWVKQGYELHKNKRSKCAFCGREILDDRWSELDRHFDEESRKLETDIDSLINQIEKHKIEIESNIQIDEQNFYKYFHGDIIILKDEFKLFIEKYNQYLDILINQLNKRKKEITIDFIFEKPDDVSIDIDELFNKYEMKRKESNEYSEKLSEEQKKTKDKLRLQKVYEFATSGYVEELEEINKIKKDVDINKQEIEKINKLIIEIEGSIQDKRRKLNDEEKGALKVNEYLINYFGYEFLSLRAVKNEDELREKKICFEIIRDGKQAFNLSEGECSLIAFCYFIAKLDDIETKGKKPIIWIDDPISSLDNNHIFFIYSLIRTEIVIANKYEQLFISTHNLNFLKYVKRFKDNRDKKGYFIIYRQYKKATIQMMPSYLIEYVTEFNYLFNEIFKCVIYDDVNDSNYNVFYNFGNNARKFLEIYLFYKYPDKTDQIIKMEKFFGKGKVPPFLVDRINNEYSHLVGTFERGATPIEVPEMQKVATLIIETLEKKDKEQFSALLNSIGISYEEYKKRKVSQINTSNITKDIDLFSEEEFEKDDK